MPARKILCEVMGVSFSVAEVPGTQVPKGSFGCEKAGPKGRNCPGRSAHNSFLNFSGYL
jgi:hypothetical protein